jgi:hypothetical protein
MNHGITNVIIKLLDREMKKPRQGKENLVYLSPVLLWVGIVCTGLFLIPGVDAVSRWAAFLYVMLPASYLAPGLGRSQEDATVTSGVCSITTLITLAVFCLMAVMIA